MDTWTALALRARSGDDAARQELIEASYADVRRLCLHLGDPDQADDLAQEVFLRVLGALPAYRAEAPARAWLFGIVRRVAADDIRRRTRRRRPVATAADGPLGDHAHDHAGDVDLHLLLEHLEHDQRAAFVLTQLWGFTYDETAAVCECPVGTVRSRVSRARAHLVRLMSGTDVSSESA